MSIISKQVLKIIEQVTREIFIAGRSPSINEISAAVVTKLVDTGGTPTIKVRTQGRKKNFNIQNFNKVMDEVDFDINIAYEELVSIVALTLKRLNLMNVLYLSQSQQLEDIIGELDNMLFTVSNADDNFYGVFDKFESLSKTDANNTTFGAMDLNERAVLLPANNLTGTKINMSHLYNRVQWPTNVVTNAEVVSNSPGSNSGFGNAFSDITSLWRQDVITSNGTDAVSIQFDIPLSSVENQEFSINRIQVIPHSESPMELEVLYSTDNINYIKLPLANSRVTMTRQAKHYNLDFNTTRIESVRVKLTKNTPDNQQSNGYRYSFGIKHFGFYTFGRQESAEFRSQALTPPSMTRPIDKVSLRVEEEVPQGTKIEYLVGLANDNGNLIGDWRAISPLNKSGNTSVPSVINFGDSSKRNISIETTDTGAIFQTTRAINFYKLPIGIKAGDDYIFGSTKLFRGFNAWNKNTRTEKVLKQIKDSYISFSPGDIQKIYGVTTEEAAPAEGYQTFPGGGASSTLQTILTLVNLIDYNAATMTIVPPSGIDINLDQRPNYSIYRIYRYRSLMKIELEQVVLNGLVPTLLAQANPLVGLSSRPVVQNNVSPPNITYTEGIDYLVEQDVNGIPTGRISRINGGLISDGDTVQVTYDLNRDITHLVDAIRDNTIYLNTILSIDPDDRFEVTYRFTPRPLRNTIIKSTVRVTEKFGDSAEGRIYEEGVDYAVDIQQGTITRIPSGNIGATSSGDISVYIDFFYREVPNTLSTYSTWVYQSNRAPVKFFFSALALDKDAGERVVLTTSQRQTLDLTDSTESPEMSFGWHNIIVKSKDPSIFGSAAIRKIISLQDDSGKFVFAKGIYFSEMQANRSPMTEVPLTYLKTSTIATNHNNFAIDSGSVVVNFQPGNTDDIYLLQANYDPNSGYSIGTSPEKFVLEYRFRTETGASSNILFRALLSKDPGSDGGITPKLHSYDLKLG